MPNTLPPVTRFTRNITREYRAASEAHRQEGMRWYAEARANAVAMSEATGLSVEAACAIVAVLSPMLSWKRNLVVARTVCEQGEATGVLRANLAKAQRILAGEPVESVVSGQKVSAFYRNILSAGMDMGTTIDRHAVKVAHGRNVPSADIDVTRREYAVYSEAYTRAARILSREMGETVTPAQIQAVTWTAARAKWAWRRA